MVRTLRSDFLINWTGAKDIEKEYKEGKCKVLNDKSLSDKQREEKYEVLNDERRRKYVCRLRSTLIEGLWMTCPDERINGFNAYIETAEYSGYPITCFTEIKLSDTYEHTKRYGCLGFGFGRKFVIERCGAPVQYVSGTEDDAIVGNIATALELLKQLPKTSLRFTDGEFLSKLKSGIEINARFIKNISDCTSPHDFKFLDEAEWRIVYTDRKTREEKLVATGKKNPKF